MNRDQATTAVKTWFPQWQAERERLDVLDKWLRGVQELPPAPKRRATSEHKMLREMSRAPWLGLVPTVLAQTLIVDGYRSPKDPTTAVDDPATGPPSPWDIWLANDLNTRQVPIVRASLGYGYSFASVMPALAPDGRSLAAIRGISPRDMYAAWADPAEDDWPILAIHVIAQPGNKYIVRLYDEISRFTFATDASGATWDYIDEQRHDAGFCPIARCPNQLDLDGRTLSEIEPLIPIARRIDKTMYDRLLAQHFLSWRVRTIAGLAEPDPPEGLTGEELEAWQRATNEAMKLRLSQEDLLVSDNPDTRFGTLDATSLDTYNAAHSADLEDLAATSQMARTNFGDMVNMPAEAFSAAETMQQRRRAERQRSITKFWNQLLRAGAGMSGNPAAAADYQASVTWADTGLLSLSQAADGLGKLATQLQIPVEALWERIPGVTRTDVAGWRKLVAASAANDTTNQLNEQLRRMAGGAGGGGSSGLTPPSES